MASSIEGTLYVVRKAFRNYDHTMLPGSVVEPDSIKWFKTRLKDRVIIAVTAHNFDEWQSYFKDKFGVDIALPEPEPEPEPAPAPEPAPKPETKTAVKKVVAVAK